MRDAALLYTLQIQSLSKFKFEDLEYPFLSCASYLISNCITSRGNGRNHSREIVGADVKRPSHAAATIKL